MVERKSSSLQKIIVSTLVGVALSTSMVTCAPDGCTNRKSLKEYQQISQKRESDESDYIQYNQFTRQNLHEEYLRKEYLREK
ncbi:hypothetical protein J4228_03755 [Candidatus Woesearchaeota archaeon]|nr:hypothetical protein [Candidatus Woesearchaeota archaeon]